MEEALKVILGYCIFALLVFGFLISLFLPKRWFWIAIFCGLFAGFIAGYYQNGFPSGLFPGLIWGILFNLLIIPFSMLTRYYQKRASERLRKK